MSNRGLNGLLARVETKANALARSELAFDQAVVEALKEHSFREVMRAAGYKSTSAVQAAKKRAERAGGIVR